MWHCNELCEAEENRPNTYFFHYIAFKESWQRSLFLLTPGLGLIRLGSVLFRMVNFRYGSLVLYLRPRIHLALVLEARKALLCKMEGQKEGWTEQALHYIRCLVPISSLETWRCGIKWELASCLDSLFVVGQIYELRFNAGRGLGELKQTTHSPVTILGQNIYIKS